MEGTMEYTHQERFHEWPKNLVLKDRPESQQDKGGKEVDTENKGREEAAIRTGRTT